MRKSRSETAETRQRILSNASRLFLTKGLASVGTRDIMAASDVVQGGFYRHFESKEQLIAEAYEATVDHVFAMFGKAIAGKSPRDAIETIVTMYLSQSPSISEVDLCPLAMLGSEIKHEEKCIRDIAMLGHQRFVNLIEAELVRLGRPQARMVAIGMISSLVGAVALASISPHKATAKQMLKDAREYILRDID
jgi:TetR/AcrR family transcriptional regulator, transcriptional repressor for nem operon